MTIGDQQKYQESRNYNLLTLVGKVILKWELCSRPECSYVIVRMPDFPVFLVSDSLSHRLRCMVLEYNELSEATKKNTILKFLGGGSSTIFRNPYLFRASGCLDRF